MRVIFTCGGTGGHINPAIAVAKLLQSRKPDAEILFVGAEDGMENKLVPREGFRLETLKISNYQRSLSPKAVAHNVATAANIAGSMRKADRILKEFQPDVIVGTGGYASFPMLKMGAKRGVPTAVHEANAVPPTPRAGFWSASRRAAITITTPSAWRSWACRCARSSSTPGARAPEKSSAWATARW